MPSNQDGPKRSGRGFIYGTNEGGLTKQPAWMDIYKYVGSFTFEVLHRWWYQDLTENQRLDILENYKNIDFTDKDIEKYVRWRARIAKESK